MLDEAAQILDMLGRRKATLAIAESYTGGLVMDAITQVPGASVVFLGGVVAYSNQSKTEILGVPRSVLRRHGAVSREAVLAMAQGARKAFAADFAVATTGIAGPTGAAPGKPIGMAYTCAAGPRSHVTKRRTHKGDRVRVKELGSQHALEVLLGLIEKS